MLVLIVFKTRISYAGQFLETSRENQELLRKFTEQDIEVGLKFL